MRRLLGLRSLAALAVVTLFVLSAAPALGNHLQCGDTITQDTRLDSDLIDCPGDGIVIGADNITLDLAGHTISGRVSGDGSAVVNRGGFSGVTIENGVILGAAEPGDVHGYYFAVTLGDCPGNLSEVVRKNRVRDLVVQGVGEIQLCGSDDNVIERTRSRITLSYSDGNLIRRDAGSMYLNLSNGNQIEDNQNTGIRFYYSEHNRFENNFSSEITFEGGDYNWVEGNDVHHPYAGLGIVDVGPGSSWTHVVGNRVSNAGEGILLLGSHNVIEGNVVSEGGSRGIASWGDSNSIERNVVSRSGGDGVFLSGSFNTVARNKTFGNAENGIRLWRGAAHNSIDRNVASANALDGINVWVDVSPYPGGNYPPPPPPPIDVALVASNSLAKNRADRNGDLGIEAVPGVIDGGGNRAFGNGNPLQCLNVNCK
jgi:parallel beta-helix repeat protein